uniref:Uncharacterized protein n=1 Tax=viral metagenome TaxID=1070528 RepID=A0A6C0CFR1_9ZZZZ
MGAKKRWLVAAIVGAILSLAFAFFRLRATSPIRDITWETKVPKHIDIAWSDDVDNSLSTVIYNIYWSNQPGINIRKPGTYRRTIQVTNFQNQGRNLARIYAPYEWVYFVITKDNFKSKEYEAQLLADSSFTCRNLNPIIVTKKDDQIMIKVAVLEGADSYILRQYLLDGTLREEEFDVKGLQNIVLKVPILPESLGYLAMKKSAETFAPEFLFYHENLSSGHDKWETVTRLC